MKRIPFTIGLAILLGMVLAVPAFAGGWAVITLDELPGQVTAGQPLEIGFMVRQHGITPMVDLTPVITASLIGEKESVTATAKAEGEVGHYVATLTFPQAGQWEWSIQAFTVNQPMPPLTVLASANVVEKPSQVPSPAPTIQWSLWLTGILGAAGILAGLVIALRQKVRWAIALVLAGIFLGAGSFVSAAAQPKVEPEAVMKSETNPESKVSQVELGRDLFIAKGCMACHSHRETNKIREFGVDVGPDLSNFTASPNYLRLWLKGPISVKSNAQMPALGLSNAEIEALIAFINLK